MISLETGDNPGISGEMSSRETSKSLAVAGRLEKYLNQGISKQFVQVFYLEGVAINL